MGSSYPGSSHNVPTCLLPCTSSVVLTATQAWCCNFNWRSALGASYPLCISTRTSSEPHSRGSPQPGKSHLCPLKGQGNGKGSNVVARIMLLPGTKGVFFYLPVAEPAYWRYLCQAHQALVCLKIAMVTHFQFVIMKLEMDHIGYFQTV